MLSESCSQCKSWRMLLKADFVSDSPHAIAVVESTLLAGHDSAHLFCFRLTVSHL